MANDRAQEVASTAAEALAALRHDFPQYQIWMVSVYIGPDTWHARLWADAEQDITVHNIDANSAEQLREKLGCLRAGKEAGRG